MKLFLKRVCAFALIVSLAFTMSGCGKKVQFNTVGVSFGNYINGATVTYQNNVTYYIKDGDIYKTDDASEGRKIIEGDMSSLNISGEKIYYYDNEISTICKANTEGDHVERIAEIYCDHFIVNKDNVFASILTGQGGDDLSDPDNYNVTSMKVTNKKVTNQKTGVVLTKAKLAGSAGDYLYVEKKDVKTGKTGLYMASLTGEELVKMLDLPDNANVLVKGNDIYVLGNVDGKYGLHMYDGNGELVKTIAETQENPMVKTNAINTDGQYIYFEDYTNTKKVEKTEKVKKVKGKKGRKKNKKVIVKTVKRIQHDNIVRISIDDIKNFIGDENAKAPEKETVYEGTNKVSEFLLSQGANGMLIKERKAKDALNPEPWEADWELIEKSVPADDEK